MKAYIIEIRESDGNDCTVYDCIVEAEDKASANDKVFNHFDKRAEAGGWESDGGNGYYFPCDCDDNTCECAHGGIDIGEPEEFASLDAAEESHRTVTYFHSRYFVD